MRTVPRGLTASLLLALLFLLALPCSADDAPLWLFCDVSSDGIGTAQLVPVGEDVRLFALEDEDWDAEGPVTRVRRSASSVSRDSDAVFAILSAEVERVSDDERQITLLLDLSEGRISASDYDALSFGLRVYAVQAGVCPVSVWVETDRGAGMAELSVGQSGEWDLVSLDLRPLDGRLQKLEITVTLGEDIGARRVVLSAPFVSESVPDGIREAEEYAETYLTDSFAEADGLSSRATEFYPGETGRISLEGHFVPAADYENCRRGVFEISLGEGLTGRLALSVLYSYTETGRYTAVSSLAIPEDGVCAIPVDDPGEIVSFRLVLRELEKDVPVPIRAIRVLTEADGILAADGGVGKLTSARREGSGKRVRFEGTVSAETAKQYPGSWLRFYAIPSWSADRIESAVEIGSIRVSTRFSFYADISGHAVSPDSWMFFAAVDAGEGQLLLLSAPRFLDPTEEGKGETLSSTFGLYDAAQVGAFEANVSHILVDVPLDDFLTSDPSGVSMTYTVHDPDKGETTAERISFNSTLLGELERDVQFYDSAGIRVYLRLLVERPIEGLTRGTTFDLSDPMSRQRFIALVKHLADRIPEVAGVVLGEAVNDPGAVAEAGFDSLADYAANLADAAQIVSQTFLSKGSSTLTILPFAEIPEDGNEDALRVPDRTLAVLIAERAAAIGNLPWGILFSTVSGDLTPSEELLTMLRENELELLSDVFYLYEPDGVSLGNAYRLWAVEDGGEFPKDERELFVKVLYSFSQRVGDRARAIFYSLADAPFRSDRDFYYLLRDEAGTGEGVFDEGSTLFEWREESVTGRLTLWDFTEVYHTMNWVPSGGMLSCRTERSTLFSDARGRYTRVLAATLQETDTGAAGITLCNLPAAVNFADVSALTFSFAVERSDPAPEGEESTVSVVFLVGWGEEWAEYYADDIPCDVVLEMSCDLREWERRGRVEYVGVAVYADYGVKLTVEKVTAQSESLTEEGLYELFHPSAEGAGLSKDDLVTLLLVAFFAVGLSAVVFVLLNRRDREIEETEEKEKRLKY